MSRGAGPRSGPPGPREAPSLAGVVFRLWIRRRPWVVFGGAAARVYGSRRPLTDVDILVPAGDLALLGSAFGSAPGLKTSELGWVRRVSLGRVELCGEVVNRLEGREYRFVLDGDLWAHRRLAWLEALPVWAASPEDCLLMKAILQRGPERGKHDLEDARSLALGRRLDLAYLRRRAAALGAEERVQGVLRRLGLWWEG
ncbi:MAG: nucleotidyltransferase family protein [Acetobacteraceae bacterium]|nr:nucleotidyltransferase family protein [Acetobacteraceae bacterium]